MEDAHNKAAENEEEKLNALKQTFEETLQNAGNYTEFPVVQDDFYQKFEPWRLKMKEKRADKTGAFVLLARRKISRALGEDPHGILSIASGTVLIEKNRLVKFIKTMNGGEYGYEAGRLYRRFQYARIYPLEKLRVRVFLTPEYPRIEMQLKTGYEKIYGELPPLDRWGGR